MLRGFAAHEVEFLLVGAYAVAVHGYPRATGDIDLYVRPSVENAVRVIAALTEFGAPLQGVSATDFQVPGIIYQVGVAPGRIDILTAIDGVSWDEAWSGHRVQDVAGLRVPVIGLEALLKNKKASGRPKDLADLAWFEERATGSETDE
jgi:hypothetical protein